MKLPLDSVEAMWCRVDTTLAMAIALCCNPSCEKPSTA
jgi:hypothetical protein